MTKMSCTTTSVCAASTTAWLMDRMPATMAYSSMGMPIEMARISSIQVQMNTSPLSTHDQWKCQYCQKHFPVPSLAREHEKSCDYAPGRDSTADQG